MRKIHFLSVVFATLLILSSACSKKDVPGPAGQDALRKEGSISGKIYKLNSAGTADTLLGTFAYEHFESQDHSSYYSNPEYYSLNLIRRSAKESNDYFEFLADYISTPMDEKPEETDLTINFSYNKALGNGKYLKFRTYDNQMYRTDIYFGSSNSTLSINNYSFNKSTGKLKFDYEMNIASYENSTYSPAKVIGSVNVTLLEQEYANNSPYMVD